jgi:hypothetical protein
MGMEGFKEGNNIAGDSVPRSFVEKRAKPVGAWASDGMHSLVCQVNFRVIKSRLQVTQRQRSLRIEIIKVESPSSSSSTAKKVVVEGMKDNSFLIVIVNFRSLMLNNLYLIATVPLVGTGVEIASIFISFQSCSDFATLLPQKKFGLRDPTEKCDYQRSEGRFRQGERTGFLNSVKEVDDDPAVRLLLIDPWNLFSPFPKSTTCLLKLSSHDR